jgi:hypothetical protein
MLEEMNRRIRRRMVTRGDVSLDVEDNRAPYDWPQLSEITSDLLQFSVHLPLDPRQNTRWPGGDRSETVTDGGVVRVLNIIVDEARILSSRERCPFLVHVEVAETGLSGTDSRLYATGATGLGATVGEALAMTAGHLGDRTVKGTSYEIPRELLDSVHIPAQGTQDVSQHSTSQSNGETTEESTSTTSDFVRGGYQGDENAFYAHNPDSIWGSNAWDGVRQREFEQLHQQMYVQQQTIQPQQIYQEQEQQPLQQR